MFQTNILNYASRLAVARHGFQSVTVKLDGKDSFTASKAAMAADPRLRLTSADK